MKIGCPDGSGTGPNSKARKPFGVSIPIEVSKTALIEAQRLIEADGYKITGVDCSPDSFCNWEPGTGPLRNTWYPNGGSTPYETILRKIISHLGWTEVRVGVDPALTDGGWMVYGEPE